MDTTIRGHRIIEGGFASEAAAAEWLYQLRTNRGALEDYLRRRLSPASPTVAQVIELYLSERGGRCASAERHRQYAAHLIPALGELKADAVRQRDVDRYVADREASGAAPKTAYNEVAFARTVLRYAWQNDALASPPRFSLHKPHCARTRVAYPDEARRLLSMADGAMRRVIAAAWTCGLRRGEILAARWSWVNVARRELVIPASVAKTRTERVVTLPDDLLALLLEEPRHPEFVFSLWRRGTNGRGELEVVGWSKQTLRRRFTELLQRADAAGLRLHDLRRSLATVAQERGHAPSAVQRVGGWEDPGVMQRHYSHAGRQAQRDVVEDMAEALGLGDGARAGTGGSAVEDKMLN